MKKLLIIAIMLLSFLPKVEGQSLNSIMQKMMEEVCIEAYKDCFSGRTYIRNSLKVRSVVVEDNKIYVKGKHNYNGYLGRAYTDVDFKADITFEGSRIHTVFYKWFVPWPVGDGHWESCQYQDYDEETQDILNKCRKLYEAE